MLPGIFSRLIQTQNFWYHLCMESFLYCSRNFSYVIYHFWPSIDQKIHGNLRFLSICDHVWISKQVDCSATVHHNKISQIWPVLVICLLPRKLICNTLQPHVFVLETLTSASLYTICLPPLYESCWRWLCTFTVLTNYQSLAIVSLISKLFNIYVPEPQQYHFFIFLCLCKNSLIRFILLTTSIFILFLRVTFIVIIFCFKLHFTYNIHCFLQCFRILIVLNRLPNGEIMYESPIFSLVLSSHKNHLQPCFKCIFLHFNSFLCIIHFIKFHKLLHCVDKTNQTTFSNQNFHGALLLFKHLHVLHQSLFILLPSICNSRKRFC